jgi:O-succinylbenzoate synthase
VIHIDGVVLHDVALALVHPFETSFGRTTERETLLVEVRGDGLTGWGELTAHEAPTFSYETIETARHVLRDFLVPRLLAGEATPRVGAGTSPSASHGSGDSGAERPPGAGRWSSVGAFLDAIRGIRGHAMAKAALEGALCDWAAKAAGVSLATWLGGVRDRVPVGVSLGIEPTIDALLDRIDDFTARGYRRIKLKVKPGWDLDVLDAVRARHPAMPLTVDANAAYTAFDVPHLLKFDRFRLEYLEQPLPYDDLVDHARLQRRIATDICLDESITGLAAARAALALGSGRIVNIKLGRVGGHRAAGDIHDLCLGAGVPVWCGGMLETGIGRAHNVAMATRRNFVLPGDISASDRYWAEDLVEPPFRLEADGTLAVPSGPGIGVTVVPERLERATRRRTEGPWPR